MNTTISKSVSTVETLRNEYNKNVYTIKELNDSIRTMEKRNYSIEEEISSRLNCTLRDFLEGLVFETFETINHDNHPIVFISCREGYNAEVFDIFNKNNFYGIIKSETFSLVGDGDFEVQIYDDNVTIYMPIGFFTPLHRSTYSKEEQVNYFTLLAKEFNFTITEGE